MTSAGPARPWRTHAALLVPVLAVTAALHSRALGTFFAADDITYLSCAVGLQKWNAAVRPLSADVAFRVLYSGFGLDPFGYHLTNLLLHLVNVSLVYAVSLRLGSARGVAAAAALLFGTSAIAFTPLHWATGLIELLTCALLLAATLLHLESWHSRDRWRWVAALVALAAMFSKETAAAWMVVVAFLEWRSGTKASGRSLAPAAAVSALFVAFFLATGQAAPLDPADPYARSASPGFLLQNLATYLRWTAVVHESIRDVVASADPGAWRTALPLALLLAAGLWWQRRDQRHPAEAGFAWWLAFLLPVLPLTHHTYLYYLYIPWAGGAIAVATLGRRLLASGSRSARLALGIAALCAYVGVQARAIAVRETARRDYLLVDRTLREAELLANALPAMRAAALPPGTRVAFVNPVRRPSVDLTTGLPTRPEDRPDRTSYWPLEAAMRGGETLRLFVPNLVYLGFVTVIPPGTEDVEYFHFDQLGRLERWGRGRPALLRQAEVQTAAGVRSAAESTSDRVRSLGDTLPTTP